MFEEFFDFGLNFRTIFLAICLAAAAVMLTYFYFKNGHVRLRPRLGEMALWSLLALMTCFGLSGVVGGLLDDPEQLRTDSSLAEMQDDDPAAEAEAEKSGGGKSSGSRIRERERRMKDASEGKRDSKFKF